jgi:Tol biopolymer transport system component
VRRALVERLILAAALAGATLLVLPMAGTAHTCTPDPEIGVSGRLLLPEASGLTLISLPDRTAQPLHILPSLGVATSVARSPDGSRLAVSRFSRPQEHQVGGEDILIVGPTGGEPQHVIGRQQPGEILSSPAWLPDGSVVLERQSVAGVIASTTIERHGLDGSAGQALVEQAFAPAVSPDGAQLVYVRPGGNERLMIRDLAGTGPERVLVDDTRFLSLAFPRFSPDGSWIAFAAASDPAFALAPPGLRMSVAHAHGIPWDIWIVRADGSERRRLTYFYDDDPSVAWSPDGQWLAVFSGEALHVVSVEGLANYCISGQGGHGGFEWLP